MLYTKLEIITILRNCLSIDEIYMACKIFGDFYLSGDAYNKEFINEVALLQINRISSNY